METDTSKPPHYHHHLKSKKPKKEKKKPIKVTYISSPVMVQAENAFEFRAIVQELTGKNSDLGRTCGDGPAFGNEDGEVIDHGNISTHSKPAFTNGEYSNDDCSNMVQTSLEFNESSFWKEVSKSSGFQFPCVLV
ncbi:hypothetical protein RHMOL_Rhmol05G0236300 [Rhododendron molle]|uniref:Uncharacterized protein n=1 Tax=Rhododendron molle TaxID=49168 RepID=A0ACC0NTC6_RHOML|nr:hypothetical protein RHMOL_Rhmol05G0236300 [Rhododendron molle]